MTIDVRSHNRDAWNLYVARGDRWTLPVDKETIERARRGNWSIVLTPTKPVPRGWFGKLAGAQVLALASGGGQQGPVLSAAGAHVTVLDNSPKQLASDAEVATRSGLSLKTVEGDMRDLSAFPSATFDLVVHPCSNLFIPKLDAVWNECFRILKPGGSLLTGFVQTFAMCLDEDAEKRGDLVLVHRAPYSDLKSRSADSLAALVASGEPLTFGHTMEAQIGGQLAAGFVITGYYDDTWGGTHALDGAAPAFSATRATRPPIASL